MKEGEVSIIRRWTATEAGPPARFVAVTFGIGPCRVVRSTRADVALHELPVAGSPGIGTARGADAHIDEQVHHITSTLPPASGAGHG